jgi:cell division protease FtsH
VTFSAPDADRFNYLEPEIRAKIKVALGGRVAEEIVFGEVSTGAESDIEQLTGLARHMIGRWGMSDTLGPISMIPRDGSGPFLPGAAEVSPETQRLLDDEVRRIVAEAQDEVFTLLTENRARLDALASALLEQETLDEDDAYAAAGLTRAEGTAGHLAAATRAGT